MTDAQRLEQVKRWANYVRASKGKWRAIHDAFINSQFEIALSFYERLKNTPGGEEKIITLRKIRNLKAIES